MHKWVLGFILAFAITAQALTLHIQSPWRSDATKADYLLHVTGGVSSYNATFGKESVTATTAEGDGWFTFTFNKELSEYYDWETFSIYIYPNTADNNFNNNNGEEWKLASEIKIKELFGLETEVWLYSESPLKAPVKSLVAPGSKILWFKSPWGNKALPQMIFGSDSLLMDFATDDESKCGWFYGAISPAVIKRNPLMTAHFIRYMAPYMALPKEGSIDLQEAFANADTIYVDGLGDMLPTTSIGTLGECFDSSRTLHVYHPWRHNSTFKDSLAYISVGNNILNNPTAMERDFYPYWFKYEFPASIVAKNEWISSTAVFNIYRRQNEWPQVKYFDDEKRPKISEFFPKGIYEAWFFSRGNGNYDLSFSPLEPKTIRLMSPWDNMSPSMIVADDTVKMGPITATVFDTTQSDTCGWYQGTFYKHTDDWNVYFKQTFGVEYYGAEGALGEGKIVSPISLDSMVALYDTVWIYPYPLSSSAPKFDNKFPGRLGICPTMKISAMLLDWAGESFNESIDIDFGGIYNGNPYTEVFHNGETYSKCGGEVLGMVQDTLSELGLPLRVDSLLFPWETCSAGREIDKWFIPQVVAKDAAGKEYTNATCRDIDLKLDSEGFWLADITESPNGCNDPINPGFYPLDDFEYLDSARTVKNPKFDWDVNGCKHNYSFSMKINAQFKYVKGQYFEFRGDDDVWVFINNRLVVDIGGCHSPIEKSVDLDSLGLIEGNEYPFQIFFSERNATGSNFKMRTSINLQTQKTYFPVEKINANGVIEYELLQLLIDESLSCDVSSTTKIDTTFAQSIFVLIGGTLPANGDTLSPGLNYGGIFISENMAGFAVDTSAFVNSRLLSPGKYTLICMLAADPSQYQMISFTVPEYPLPDIAFVDVFGLTDSLILNNENITLRGDIMTGGKNDTLLSFVQYPDTVPLKVVLLFGNTPCGDMDEFAKVNCATELEISSPFPLSFFDENNQRISTLTTDEKGYARFFVVGDSTMTDAYFTIKGAAVANEIHWQNIHFVEPPVPFVTKAQMFDVNGDGIPDSLSVPFNKPFDKVVPDTLAWNFGGTEFYKTSSQKNIWPLVFNDSIITLFNEAGLKREIFTGASDEIYKGTLRYHYTYIDEDSNEEVELEMNSAIEDKVGPVIISASIKPLSDEISTITVNLSEGTIKNSDLKSAFIVYRDSLNFMDSLTLSSVDENKNGNIIRLYFSKGNLTLPEVGDFIKLAPNVLQDFNKNFAAINNPKIRIEGEQRTEIKAPGLVIVNKDFEWNHKQDIVPIHVPTNKPIQEIVDSLGLPGLLLNFNLGELATSVIMNLPNGANKDSALATIKINWENFYYSHLGNFVNKENGTIFCNDSMVFYNPADPSKSNCYDNPGKIFFKWNAKSNKGRLVGTGAYIAKIKTSIISENEKAGHSDDTFTLGIKRAK